jgi:hypothetical protein
MKKILLSLFTLITFFSNLNAQETSFGIKAGVNYAFINGDIPNVIPDIKYHAGAFLNFSFTDLVALQPEFIFSVKGFGDDKENLDLSYIDVPVLFKLNLADKISFHLGPQFSYLLSSDYTSDINTDNFEERINDFDISAAAGMELELLTGLSLGARYSFSVISIGKDYDLEKTVIVNNVSTQVVENIEDPDYKNGVIQLFAAFKF